MFCLCWFDRRFASSSPVFLNTRREKLASFWENWEKVDWIVSIQLLWLHIIFFQVKIWRKTYVLCCLLDVLSTVLFVCLLTKGGLIGVVSPRSNCDVWSNRTHNRIRKTKKQICIVYPINLEYCYALHAKRKFEREMNLLGPNP